MDIKKISIFCLGQERVIEDIYKVESVLINEFNGKSVTLHLLSSSGTITVLYLSIVDYKIFHTFVKNKKEKLFSIKDILS